MAQTILTNNTRHRGGSTRDRSFKSQSEASPRNDGYRKTQKTPRSGDFPLTGEVFQRGPEPAENLPEADIMVGDGVVPPELGHAQLTDTAHQQLGTDGDIISWGRTGTSAAGDGRGISSWGQTGTSAAGDGRGHQQLGTDGASAAGDRRGHQQLGTDGDISSWGRTGTSTAGDGRGHQ